MRSSWFTVLAAGAAGLVVGCKDDPSAVVTPDTPRAIVRFINAVPDTLGTDWRFIDRLTGSPVELALGFRGVGPYQAAAPGSRPLRVFPATTDLSTQNFFIDQAVTLDANKRYTLAHVGMSRAGQTPVDQLLVVEDIQPTVPTDKIAIRAWHLGTGIGNVDIYVSKAGGTTPLPATAQWTNVAYLASTPFVMIDPGPKTNVTGIGAIVGGYTRDAGSFATDGFTVGQQITAAGFATAANNGRSIVSSIIPARTTGAANIAVIPAGFVRTGGSFVADGFVAGMAVTTTGFSTPGNNGRFYVTRVTADSLIVGTTTGSISMSATATTYVRSTGSFIADGFYVGETVTASGFTVANAANNNNGQGVITNLTATVMTMAAKTPPMAVEAASAGKTITKDPPLVAEAAGAGKTIVSGETMMVTKATQTIPALATGSQSLVGELVYRATLTGTTAVIAEWTALTGLPADALLGQEAIGGNTMAGSALVGILMPRSVSGSTAPQTPPTTVPPTPPYNAPTFIFAIDKHPR